MKDDILQIFNKLKKAARKKKDQAKKIVKGKMKKDTKTRREQMQDEAWK